MESPSDSLKSGMQVLESKGVIGFGHLLAGQHIDFKHLSLGFEKESSISVETW